MSKKPLPLLAVLVGICILIASCSRRGQEADPVIVIPTSAGSPSPVPAESLDPITQVPISPTEIPIVTTTVTALSSAEALKILSSLPISFPVTSEEIAAYFNQIAREDDIALVPVAYLELLPKITAGKTKVGFASWAQAEQNLPLLADRIDIVTYNPEHWDQTPEEEKSRLGETVQRAEKLAHELGLILMVAPDRRFAEESLAQIAPYTDYLGLQGQRIQDNPAEFAGWLVKMIRIARENNPDVRIFVQVGATQGSAGEMLAAIQTVAGEIDGISIWSNPATLGTLKDFIALIRAEG